MTNYYVPLFLLFIGVYLIQIGIFSKRYTEKLAPYFWNGRINWNPNVDRLKLLVSLTFLIAPGTLMKSFIKFNSNNAVFNYSVFLVIISLILFLIWFDIKKIAPFTLTKKIIKGKTEDLNIKLNELFKKFEGLNSEVTHIEKTTINIQKKSFQTKSDIEDLRNSFDSFKKSSEQFDNDIKKEMSLIKKKLEPKKRKLIKKEQNELKIKRNFPKLIEDLENHFPFYNKELKSIDYKKFDFTELQAYQILLIFFKRNYDLNIDKINNTIYPFFNNYFKMECNMKMNNWTQYGAKQENKIEENELYNDLYFYIKKSTQQLSKSN
ncbi:hypothetical protein [Tenacibaculum sp.]|uniref:hypothetical protein n=1 Tax=Tenacibaculum sp. TaxID=1906242 RepID=UPI003AA86CF8